MNRRPLAIISIFFIIGIVFAKFLPDSVIFFHISAISLVLIFLALTLSPEGRGSFNYREYLERQNIFALINTKEHNVTILSYNYKSNPILKYTYLIREKLKNRIIDKMPLESGAFMRAILLGDRSELPKDIQKNFKNSGTMHILPTQCRGKSNLSAKSHVTLYKSIS